MSEDFKKRIDLGRQSSMSIWYPKLVDLDIPQIKTEIIKVGNDILSAWIRKGKELPDKYKQTFEEQLNIFGTPLFLRTDQASMKHSWNDTCYIETKDDFENNLRKLLEEHEMNNMAGELQYDDIVFRELLDLETSFTCFGNGFPVNKEVRCFIKDGKIQDIRNYWVKDAIAQGNPVDVDWVIKLENLKALSTKDFDELHRQLNEVCKVFPEYWSVDFAKAKDGTWYLIDMARGEVSFQSDEIIQTNYSEKT